MQVFLGGILPPKWAALTSRPTKCTCLCRSKSHEVQSVQIGTPVLGGPFVKRTNGSSYPIGQLSVCLSCLSVTLVYCGQTVGWIKMPLGMEVGLDPRHIALDGDPAPSKMGHRPNFRPMTVVAKRLDGSKCHLVVEVGLGPGDIVLDGDPASNRPLKGGTYSSPETPDTFRPTSIVAKRLDRSRCHFVRR